MDYEEAKSIIDKQGYHVRGGTGVVSTHNPSAKKLKNKTWLRYDQDGHYTLAYFNKNIIEFHPKYVVLNDHSFFSSSTMQRFNEYMPRGFHMRGCVYRSFKLKRPLGFITTPAGTFPYTMPSSFTYDGDPFDHGGLYPDVVSVLQKLPKYVDGYLDELLSGKPGFIDDELAALRAFDRVFTVGGTSDADKFRISRFMGTAIAQNHTYKYLAALAASQIHVTIEGMELERAVRLMIQYGSDLFSVQSKAGRMEAVLLAGTVPTINKQQLRKAIRHVVIEHIVDLLGFDEVQWNRR